MSDTCWRCGQTGMAGITHACTPLAQPLIHQKPMDYEGCGCGHKLAFCHKVNAARYCGLPTPDEELRQALIACAEAAGADMSDGVPTWPDLHVWALQAVRQLRADYDEAIRDA